MVDFITQEFKLRSINTLILNDLHNVFIENLNFRSEKHYDLTLEDIMSDNVIDNQKNSINFLSNFIIEEIKKRKMIEDAEDEQNQNNQVTCICDCCGKKYIRLFDYELCDECEKYYYNQACREDYINWFKPRYIKNQIEIETTEQRDIEF